METNNVLALPRRDAQVDVLVAYLRILVVDDEPMSPSVENNLVEIL